MFRELRVFLSALRGYVFSYPDSIGMTLPLVYISDIIIGLAGTFYSLNDPFD